MYCIHVSGHDPLTFSFGFLFLFDWVGVLWPQLSKVSVAAGVHVFISGESLHVGFLVGVQIKVMATSDL